MMGKMTHPNSLMIAYPTVTITNNANNEAGIPFFRKSDAPINL
jgi:hypothetical protein